MKLFVNDRGFVAFDDEDAFVFSVFLGDSIVAKANPEEIPAVAVWRECCCIRGIAEEVA